MSAHTSGQSEPNDVGVARNAGDIARLPRGLNRLRGVGLVDRDMYALREFQRIQDLDLSECEKLTDGGIDGIVALHQLVRVVLSGCVNITDNGVCRLSTLPQLAALDLSFCASITNRGLRCLGGLPVLRVLNLNWCYAIGDEGLSELARLPALEEISLWSCEELTDYGLAELARAPKLRVVDLPEFSSISDIGIETLVARAPNLECLRLANLDNVTDAALGSLSRARAMKQLILSHCYSIGDLGIRQLRALATLARLEVRACPKVSVEAISELRAALPGMQLTFAPE